MSNYLSGYLPPVALKLIKIFLRMKKSFFTLIKIKKLVKKDVKQSKKIS